MAWSASKIMTKTLVDKMTATNAVDYNSDTFKAALYGNTITPDNTVDTAALSSYNGVASQWVTGGEITDASGWPAGGQALASVTCVKGAATAVITFDAADTASANSTTTLSAVYGCLVQDTTVSGVGLCYNYFGGTNSVTSGSFTIVWSASGIFTLTLT